MTDEERPIGGWLLVLATLLTVGEPLGLAPVVAHLLPTIAERGAAIAALLGLRVLTTAFGVAAGLALFGRRPHAVALARLALVLLGAVSVFSILTPILPSNLAPGLPGPVALVVVAYYVCWIVYLQRSRRVRATFE